MRNFKRKILPKRNLLKNQKINRFKVFEIIFLVISAVVSIISVKIAFDTLQTNIQSNKAYVVVDKIETKKENQFSWIIYAVAVNGGETPASDIKFSSKHYTYYDDPRIPEKYSGPDDLFEQESFTLGPKGEFKIRHLAGANVNDIKKHVITGFMVYKDIYGDIRQTKYCYEFDAFMEQNGPNLDTLKRCSEYNCIDDSCNQ